MIKQLVEHAVRELVDLPEKVRVEVIHDNLKTTVDVHVAEDDLKRVIGKDGRIIKALRTMICALELANDKDIIVNVTQ